jgi:hypothetical protein
MANYIIDGVCKAVNSGGGGRPSSRARATGRLWPILISSKEAAKIGPWKIGRSGSMHANKVYTRYLLVLAPRPVHCFS